MFAQAPPDWLNNWERFGYGGISFLMAATMFWFYGRHWFLRQIKLADICIRDKRMSRKRLRWAHRRLQEALQGLEEAQAELVATKAKVIELELRLSHADRPGDRGQ